MTQLEGGRLRGGRPPDEPRAGGPRPGRAGGRDAAHAPRPAPRRDAVVDGQSVITRSIGIERVWITPGRRRRLRGRPGGHRRRRADRPGPGQPLHEPPAEPPPAGRSARPSRGVGACGSIVCNVATQDGETTGFDLADHVEALVAHAGPEHRRRRPRQQPARSTRSRAGADASRSRLRWPPTTADRAALVLDDVVDPDADPIATTRCGSRPP